MAKAEGYKRPSKDKNRMISKVKNNTAKERNVKHKLISQIKNKSNVLRKKLNWRKKATFSKLDITES